MSFKILSIALLALTVSYSYQACCADCVNSLTADPDVIEGEDALPAVTVLTAPKTDGFNATGFCGAIWTNQAGTCCDQETLHARSVAWKKRLRSRYGKIRSGLAKIDAVAKKAAKLSTFVKGKKDTLKSSDKKLKADDKKKNKTSPGKRVLTMTDDEITAIETTLTEVDKKKDKFAERGGEAKEQINTCFATLTKLRFSSLCLRCSGNGDQFYDAVNKVYKVKAETCSAAVKDCGAIMGLLMEASNLFEAILKVKAALGQKISNHIAEFPVTNEQATNWATCADDATACSTNTALVAKICTDFTLSLPSPAEDTTRADDADGLSESARLLAASPSKMRVLADTATDGYGNVVIDNTVGVDVKAVDSGDSEFNLDNGDSKGGSYRNKLEVVIALLTMAVVLFN